jgi:hypothetical protein
MGVSFSVSGSFSATEQFLKSMQKFDIRRAIESKAETGVAALASATPMDTGLAAHSWGYEIVETKTSVTIWWTNNDIENGYPVAVMAQYGHGTGTGGYVQGRDFINPAIRPIFDQILLEVERLVRNA